MWKCNTKQEDCCRDDRGSTGLYLNKQNMVLYSCVCVCVCRAASLGHKRFHERPGRSVIPTQLFNGSVCLCACVCVCILAGMLLRNHRKRWRGQIRGSKCGTQTHMEPITSPAALPFSGSASSVSRSVSVLLSARFTL